VAFEEPIDQALIEIETLFIDRSATGRNHARPSNAETVGVDPEPRHEIEIALVAVIMVTRDIAGPAVLRPPFAVGKSVPYAGQTAVLTGGSFDLVSRGGDPQAKVGAEPGTQVHESGLSNGRRGLAHVL